MIIVPTRRESFILGCLRHLGETVVWGGLDCSDLCARGELAAGLPDRRATHTARLYSQENRQSVEKPQLGDLGFYGESWDSVIHVVIALWGGLVLSADGATSRVTDPEAAAKLPSARVRIHHGTEFYRSVPFLGWRHHRELDPSER